ncbi:uncharacterized protein VP01_2556g1 [Puccinia sorghi]|uniref:Uncharacterized protein n=1 Tax=Puccinia sorghi TaxID=27349 RepID=A0A0L6V556_9BASI|nr:uncharacterized protein VP01_2556g1 [Puccinia sorghi]
MLRAVGGKVWLPFLVASWGCLFVNDAGSTLFFPSDNYDLLPVITHHLTYPHINRWVFLLEGMGTVLIALFALYYLPNSLEKAPFLTPEEREFAGE